MGQLKIAKRLCFPYLNLYFVIKLPGMNNRLCLLCFPALLVPTLLFAQNPGRQQAITNYILSSQHQWQMQQLPKNTVTYKFLYGQPLIEYNFTPSTNKTASNFLENMVSTAPAAAFQFTSKNPVSFNEKKKETPAILLLSRKQNQHLYYQNLSDQYLETKQFLNNIKTRYPGFKY
jgi:hypothetical protein